MVVTDNTEEYMKYLGYSAVQQIFFTHRKLKIYEILHLKMEK